MIAHPVSRASKPAGARPLWLNGTVRVSPASNTDVDAYSEDLSGPALPPWAETYLAGERAWHRLLRGTGAVCPEEVAADLSRWMEGGPGSACSLGGTLSSHSTAASGVVHGHLGDVDAPAELFSYARRVSAQGLGGGVATTASPPVEVEQLVKSRQRVADHGEVFTPTWMVEAMLDLVKGESERIDSRVLEPACGAGNFLIPVLVRKLATVQYRYGKNEFEKRHYALFALMCTYGIELLPDNAQECRENLAAVFNDFLGLELADDWARSARAVLAANIVQGDALTMTDPAGQPIRFPEWGYLGKGRFQRRDFRYDALTQRASFEGTLFGELDDEDLFTPVKTYPVMTAHQIADQAS